MQAGQTHAGYTLVRPLGRGSRAVVWEVTDADGQFFALKVLDTLAQGAPDRLRNEYTAQKILDHPNVVRVFDLVEVGNNLALVLEMVRGGDLRDYIDRIKPSQERALEIFGGVLRGLMTAHDNGLVHRDLKPGNVLMTRSGSPKISDFGLVKNQTSGGLTQSGMVLGTVRYMPPEQLHDPSSVDQRADIFSAGCILFELLCHTRCFDAPNKVALMNKVRMGEHEPFPDHVPESLQALIGRMIHKERAERPASVQEILEELRLPTDPMTDFAVPERPEEPKREFPFALVAAVVAGVLIAAALAAFALLT